MTKSISKLQQELATLQLILSTKIPNVSRVFDERKIDAMVEITYKAYNIGQLRPLFGNAQLEAEDIIWQELETSLSRLYWLRFMAWCKYFVKILFCFLPGLVLILIAHGEGVFSDRVNAECWIHHAADCRTCRFLMAIRTPDGELRSFDYTLEIGWSYFEQRTIFQGDPFKCCPINLNCCETPYKPGAFCDQYGTLGKSDCPTAYPWRCSYLTDIRGEITQLKVDTDTLSFPMLIAGLALCGVATLHFPLYPIGVRIIRVVKSKCAKGYVAKEKIDKYLVKELSYIRKDEDDEQRRKSNVDVTRSTSIELHKAQIKEEFGEYSHSRAMHGIINPLFAPRTLEEAFPDRYPTNPEPNPAVFLDAWELSQWRWPSEEGSSKRMRTPQPTSTERLSAIRQFGVSVLRKAQRREPASLVEKIVFDAPAMRRHQVLGFRANTPAINRNLSRMTGHRYFTRYDVTKEEYVDHHLDRD